MEYIYPTTFPASINSYVAYGTASQLAFCFEVWQNTLVQSRFAMEVQ